MPRTVLSLKSSHCGDPTALKAVLFDLDGTLIDTLDMIKASLRYATETVLGRVIPDEVLMHNVGIPLVVQMAEFDPDRAEELLATYREHNLRVHDAMVREYPYVEESLERLVGLGLKLGIVTSKSGTMARRGLDRFSLDRFFETVVSCDDVTIFKPNPYPLEFAAARMGLEAGSAPTWVTAHTTWRPHATPAVCPSLRCGASQARSACSSRTCVLPLGRCLRSSTSSPATARPTAWRGSSWFGAEHHASTRGSHGGR